MRPTEIDTSQYDSLLQKKRDAITAQFATFNPPPIQVYASEPVHYRMRAEFRVWHQGDDLFHIMFDPLNKEKYRVDHFPPASKLINEVMAELIDLLRPNPTLRRKLYQIDYLSTMSGQILVSLIYHRQLDEQWELEARGLKEQLRAKFHLDLVGRARKQKVLLDQDFVVESLPVHNRQYQFKQIENSFTQPNAVVNCKMIEWALDCTKGIGGDLVELYCGLGNFTLPLAQHFDQVLATEISKSSVAAAQWNIDANHIDNVKVLRLSSEEFSQAMNGEQTFKRLEGLDLAAFNCRTVLVDPPRAGLDDDTCAMISRFDNILYISCNPDTLLENLQMLTKTHRIERFALFDQFPYTHHAECGVFLMKK
ncbi:tRNA (uridine(54)-C5)-methyltransferase TrmA [Aliiglaciecola sp. CAU 1673]|uniref:tRNA (uridine(54)-C5)-methyltransferase TrmA n=1 Tax=Aliiglaciecola sp. CAU 1673 TaxID=3032595 RepID=UPI0023DC0479|nr:tRNA (uridine(54)-C5)-methyltransferase TrmA [Aliiglaciecola sp. CAU 1673]MDF2180338.1 tRNA (uridine(54)-C5)-methyltransferase TrmA [Aliiglaciecola sp. CAU 1673]